MRVHTLCVCGGGENEEGGREGERECRSMEKETMWDASRKARGKPVLQLSSCCKPSQGHGGQCCSQRSAKRNKPFTTLAPHTYVYISLLYMRV